MQLWDTLSPAEQTLVRQALWRSGLAGTVEQYNTGLRWAGAPGAVQRSLGEAEQRVLVPELAAVLVDLAERGLVVVRMRTGMSAAATDPVLTEAELLEVLAEPANWFRRADAAMRFDLDATGIAREWWQDSAVPEEVPDGLPRWDGLTREQQEVLVCASEASGLLTGPFGVLADLPDGLTGAELTDWLDEQLAPLVEFVGRGWLEVRHFATSSGSAYTVVPQAQLRTAFADRELRHDDGDEWGVGFTCVFTYAGLGVWRGSGWGAAWGSTLRFD
ncbi:hypothetical protein [Kitasatospora viridis]|nr:hypothetical protein [Kitasatospora viridis]